MALRQHPSLCGDFVSGYRESDSFLRYLVERLVLQHGRPYDSAVRRVITGAASGWHGGYFVQHGQPGYDESVGLTSRMREVVRLGSGRGAPGLDGVLRPRRPAGAGRSRP